MNYKRNYVPKDNVIEFDYNTKRISQLIKPGADDKTLKNIILERNNNYDFLNDNKLYGIIDNLTTGRITKSIFFLKSNDNYIIGNGPFFDRVISNKSNYKINNDSASAIIYTYLSSGIIGLLFLFYFTIIVLKKIYHENKNKFFFLFSQSMILCLIFRGIFENGFTIFGVDFMIILLSVGTLQYYNKKRN